MTRRPIWLRRYLSTPLVGSQLKLPKDKLPVGVYIVAGWTLIGFAISFFNTSQNGTLFTIAMFVQLLLGIGLLFRWIWPVKSWSCCHHCW